MRMSGSREYAECDRSHTQREGDLLEEKQLECGEGGAISKSAEKVDTFHELLSGHARIVIVFHAQLCTYAIQVC